MTTPLQRRHYYSLSSGALTPTSRIAASSSSAAAHFDDMDSEWLRIFSTYRIQFACVHTGKYVPSTKRKISWRFGCSNRDALRKGWTGLDCKGEEYEVHLIWSVKSGKAKIVWNNQDISDVCPSDATTSVLKFKWQAASGETFKIVAHAAASPGFRQYDLFINDRSFFSLPLVSELGTKDFAYAERFQTICGDRASTRRTHGGRGRQMMTNNGGGGSLWSSFGGFSSMTATLLHNGPVIDDFTPGECQLLEGQGSAMEDELHSEVYSTTFETLRDDVTASVPVTASMMSQAIIIAFSDEGELDAPPRRRHPTTTTTTTTNTDKYISAGDDNESVDGDNDNVDAMAVEADALWEAYEWMKWNRDSLCYNAYDKKLSFMQEQVNQMVINVRKGVVSPPAASQAIHSVASVLELELATPLPRNTVVLLGLRKNATREDLREVMEHYGQVDSCAVTTNQSGFGVCRFRSTSAVARATDASFRREIVIQDVYPQIIELQNSSFIMSHPTTRGVGAAASSSSLPFSLDNNNNNERNHNINHPLPLITTPCRSDSYITATRRDCQSNNRNDCGNRGSTGVIQPEHFQIISVTSNSSLEWNHHQQQHQQQSYVGQQPHVVVKKPEVVGEMSHGKEHKRFDTATTVESMEDSSMMTSTAHDRIGTISEKGTFILNFS